MTKSQFELANNLQSAHILNRCNNSAACYIFFTWILYIGRWPGLKNFSDMHFFLHPCWRVRWNALGLTMEKGPTPLRLYDGESSCIFLIIKRSTFSHKTMTRKCAWKKEKQKNEPFFFHNTLLCTQQLYNVGYQWEGDINLPRGCHQLVNL